MSPHTAEIPLVPGDALAGMRRSPEVSAAATDVEIEVADLTFEVFFRETRDRVGKALALSIGDRDLATEAVDEAMIRAYQHWNRVATLDNPAAWVYRVGLNYCLSRFRRAKRKIAFVGRHSELDHQDTPFSDSIADPRLGAALAHLPIPQRSVVVSRVLLGLSEAETAKALGIRPGTVKSRLHRSLANLRQQLEQPNAPTTTTIPISNDEDLS